MMGGEAAEDLGKDSYYVKHSQENEGILVERGDPDLQLDDPTLLEAESIINVRENYFF